MNRAVARGATDPSGPRPLTVSGLLLLDPLGHGPTPVESMTFGDDGIGVVRVRGQEPRVLPWDSVIAHAVEPWAGGVVPASWAGTAEDLDADGRGIDRSRPLPYADPGVLVSIHTQTGTYRFLHAGGDTTELAARVSEFAVHHHGPSAASSVTTVSPHHLGTSSRPGRSGWERVRPWLVVLLVVVLASAVTLILLQSAGTIHLPVLGGGASPTGLPAH